VSTIINASVVVALCAAVTFAGTSHAQSEDADRAGADERDVITVTARRREERLQDVPVAVRVFSQDTLDKLALDRVEDLERISPSLRLNPTSGRRNSTAVELRGIGAVETSVTQDTPLAFYLNEVIQSRPIGLNQSLFDLESVQVLYGPQGTLFGRNATAGAVLLTTRKPTHDFGGRLDVAAGNYERVGAALILNVPMTESLAVRFAGQHRSHAGYSTNILTGEDLDDEDVTTLRLSALFEPSARFANLLVADYYNSSSNGSGNVISAIRPCATPPGPPTRRPLATCNATLAPLIAAAFADQQSRDIRSVALNALSSEDATAWGVSDTASWELNDAVTVRNIVGYREIDLASFQDSDGTPVSLLHVGLNGQEGHQISDELQVLWDLEGFEFIGGVFYFSEKNEELSTSFALGSPVSSINNGLSENTSASVFAQATIATPIDGLRLTLGGRYTHDERDVELRSRRGTGACRLVDETNTALDPCERNLSASFDVPTWNVSLDYRINDDAMVYVAHRHGYRAGGFNIRATSPLQSIAFDPEEVDDIEVGAKLSGSVGGIGYHWNLAAYQMWYKDIQRTVAQVFNGVLVAGVFNNADAEIGGFETDFSIDLTDELFLTGSWAYVDAVHTRFDSGGMSLDDIGFGQAEHNITGAVTWSPYESERWGAVSGTLSFTSRSPWFSQQALPAFEPEARVG